MMIIITTIIIMNYLKLDARGACRRLEAPRAKVLPD